MASPLPDFDPKQSFALFSKHGHSGWLGLQFVDNGADWVELELPWREDLLGEEDRHVLASGPIISLLDMACGLSIWTASKTFKPVATLDLRVDYQRPAKERSSVIGRAQCYRLTKSAAFVRGYAHDGNADDPVATMAGVFMTIARDPRRDR